MRTIHTVTTESEEKEKYYEEDESLLDAQERYYGEAESFSEVDRLALAVWGKTQAPEKREGYVEREDFKSVFKGTLPESTQPIRRGKPNAQDKERLAYDLVLSAPKSVSMALHLEGDLRVFDAHMDAVQETLAVVEKELACARIQVNGERQVVKTGNLIAVLLPHHTSRDGDMQLHTHTLIMNGTKCPDGEWRALWKEPLANAEWVGGLYRQKLAEKMQGLGYRIYNTEHGFELQGYSRKDLEVFSKRHQEIVKAVEKDGLSVNAQNKKAKVLTTRKAKSKGGKSLEEKQALWREEARSRPISQVDQSDPIHVRPKLDTAKEEVDSAIRHLCERSVSFSRHDVYTYAYQHIRDGGRDFEQITQAINEHKSLLNVGNDRFTTVEALHRELETFKLWMSGQEIASPLLNTPDLEGTRLKSGQAEAVWRTLTSTDTHQIIHGLSGVGKTTALGVLKQQLELTNVEVRGFSPTIEAAAQLQQELGIKTNTVAHLTLSQPEKTENQLWIIDEAGMVSARQMQAIAHKAQSVKARILLVGDKGQNSSVEAGSPLRSLMKHGATTHSLRDIIRQQNSTQRQAVELMADGNGAEALELLNNNGYVTELTNRNERARAIAEQYLNLSQTERNQTLIVTGTNAERLSITQALRTGLRAEGKLGGSVKAVQLVSRQFTQEQAKQVRNYQVGDYLRLHRDYHSTPLQPGQLYKVERVDPDKLLVSSCGGRLYRFNPSKYKDKQVFFAQEIDIAVGDRLRWTATDKKQGRVNGKYFTVSAFGGTAMVVTDDKGVNQEVSLLQPLAVDYSHVSTSYRAQGKTAKRVIVSATSDPTSSQEPFYVKISRQTKELYVYTQDLEQLQSWVKRSLAQLNPLELIGSDIQQRVRTLPSLSHDEQTTEAHRATELRTQRAEQPVLPSRPSNEQSPEDISHRDDRLSEAIVGKRVSRMAQRLEVSTAQLSQTISELVQSVQAVQEQEALLESGLAQKLTELTTAVTQKQSEVERQEKFEFENMGGLAEAILDNRVEAELVESLKEVRASIEQLDRTIEQATQMEKVEILSEAIVEWQNGQELAQAIASHLAVFDQVNQQVNEMVKNHPDRQHLAQVVQSLQQISVIEGLAGEELKSLGETLRQQTSSSPEPHPAKAFWQPEYPVEPPRHINQKHWEEFKQSAIHPDLIALNAESISARQVYERLLSEKFTNPKYGAGQYVTVPIARELKKYEQIAQGGWWGNAGINALSLTDLKDGEKPLESLWGCYKPDSPRIDQQKSQSKGKTECRKYENPASTKRVPFLPQVSNELAEQIYHKHGINPTEAERQSGFWYVVKQYPQIPITITEGFKKTLSSLSQGEVTIGLTGVNHIYRSKDDLGNKLPQRQLNEEVAVFAQPNREFRFAYDQDTKPTTICNVRRDMVRGIELLEAQGSTVKVVKWNSEDGKGLDDLIANQGPLAYSSAQRKAIPSELDKRTHYRTEYNKLAKKVNQEMGSISVERLDLEVYIRASLKGELADGARVVGESDEVRFLREQHPDLAQHYVGAIASVAGTYGRMSQRDVRHLDELARQFVQRQTVALALEAEKALVPENAYTQKHQFGPRR